MKQLLKDTQDRLMEKVASLKYVDEDWGQLDYYSPHHPVKWPCALIDITATTWSNVGKHAQLGNVVLKLQIANMRLTNSSGMAPAGQKQAAFFIREILEDIQAALHGWAGSAHYGPLTRLSERRIRRDDGVQLYEVLYGVQLTDSAAQEDPPTTPRPTVRIVPG